MDKKCIVITILVLALVVLAGFTYNVYSGAMECKAGVIQLQAGLGECMVGVQVCQDALTALSQIPACAQYIPAE